MSQPNPYTTRGGFNNKLPDRSTSGLHNRPAPSFGISAPQFGQRTDVQPQTTYTNYSNAPGPQQYGVTAGPSSFRPQAQLQNQGLNQGQDPAQTHLERPSQRNYINELSDEQKAEVNEAFSLFDVDKDRHLDYHEFRVALRALGFDIPKDEALSLLVRYGVPKPNAQPIQRNLSTAQGSAQQSQYHPSSLLLPHQPFLSISAQKISSRDPKEEVARAFSLFDIDGKEYISLDDLRRVARDLGETGLDDNELRAMIEEFDFEGRGGIGREVFEGICLQ